MAYSVAAARPLYPSPGSQLRTMITLAFAQALPEARPHAGP